MGRTEKITTIPSGLTMSGLFFTSGRQTHASWKGVYKHKLAEQRQFPRCVVYLRLSCSSWALFIKLLKTVNYLSFAVYRTTFKPQRKLAVLALTETTDVTRSKFRGLLFQTSLFHLNSGVQIWSTCLSAPTSVTLFLRQGKRW